MIKIISGDVTHATEDIITHQVNCKGVMGAGVAKAIRAKYPTVFSNYRKYCSTMGSTLLGKIQILLMDDGKRICNVFGQDSFGRDKQYTEVSALDECFKKLSQYAYNRKLTVAMPFGIGCGLGGAEWIEVYSLLKKYFDGSQVNLTLYKK